MSSPVTRSSTTTSRTTWPWAVDQRKREIECASIQIDYAEIDRLPLVQPKYWSSLTGPIERQWDRQVLGAPLHAGAERYYREQGVL